MNKSRAQILIDNHATHKGGRANFESYWQSLHDYFYLEAEDVNRSYYPGTELSATYLFDSTTIESADVLASGFMNYLTPATSKWFALRHRNPELRNNKRVCKYFEDVADEINYTLNRSNFYNQNVNAYKSSGVYGTSVLMGEDDDKEDVRFLSLPIKNVCLVEDAAGRVQAYYLEFEFTAEQAAGKWGMEKLARPLQEELTKETTSTKKWPFLLYIAERYARDIRKTDKKNMPIEAVWIDHSNKVIVDESGYNEFPAFCHRFDKRPFIPWGFSPAMKALPFARILNAIAKTNLRGAMKLTDGGIAIPSNAFIMPFNNNPQAVNYYNPKEMPFGKDSIIQLGTNSNPQVGMMMIEYYQNKVRAIMHNDVFLAFSNITKQMNNPEVAERIAEKMTLLGPAVGRYISEMLNPIIIRTYGILSRRGRLPMPPDELYIDPNYEIDCISQLAQAQRKSELNALVSGLAMVAQVSQYSQEVIDKIDPDKVVDEAWDIIGAPKRVMREDDEVSDLREARGKAALAQQQMMLAQQGADVIAKGAKADESVAKAGALNAAK